MAWAPRTWSHLLRAPGGRFRADGFSTGSGGLRLILKERLSCQGSTRIISSFLLFYPCKCEFNIDHSGEHQCNLIGYHGVICSCSNFVSITVHFLLTYSISSTVHSFTPLFLPTFDYECLITHDAVLYDNHDFVIATLLCPVNRTQYLAMNPFWAWYFAV